MSIETFSFFYDFSSPFAYLAATQVERIAAENNARVNYHPMLLGALFKEIGTPMVPVATFAQAKRDYYMKDMLRWAAHWNVDFAFPTNFPMNTVTALRLTLAAEAAGHDTKALIQNIFRAYWVDGRDIKAPEVLTEILQATGLPVPLLEATQDPAIKEKLKTNTAEAVAAGVCGAPSFLVGNLLFWGQDRLDFVAKALQGWQPDCG